MTEAPISSIPLGATRAAAAAKPAPPLAVDLDGTLALAGCGTYREPLYFSDGTPMLNNGRQTRIVRCCSFLGVPTAGSMPGRRSRMGAGFWAGHGLAAPSR